MSSDQFAALGAFLSGAGSVIGAAITISHLRKRMRKDCEQRIAEIRAAIHEGVEIGEGHRQ
jgi:hypothetical protein